MTPYAKRMTSRYVLALLLIAALLLFGGWIQRVFDDEQQQTLAAIQMSEQQRSLAKRAGRLGFRLILTDSPQERLALQREMIDLTEALQRNHDAFVSGDTVLNIASPDSHVDQILYSAPYFLDRETQNFIDQITYLAEAPPEDLTQENARFRAMSSQIVHGRLSSSLDQLVGHYQQEGWRELTQRRLIRNGTIALSLVLLTALGLFIFRPMTRRVEHDMALLDENRTKAEEAQQYAVFMAEASRALTSSLDQRTILDRLTHLIVPQIADYCVIDAIDSDGGLARLAAAHVDRRKEEFLKSTAGNPVSRVTMGYVDQVLRSGKALIIGDVTNQGIENVYEGEAPRSLLRKLEPRSIMLLPLGNSDRSIGIMTLVYSESGRRYADEDRSKAEELGRRTLLAIDNARLFQQATQAVQARDEIMGVVSHDLRNPLSVVMTTTGALLNPQQTFSDETKHKLLLNLKRSSERMNRLIQDLLDVSRLEAGQLSLTLRPTQPEAVIEETVEAQLPLASERGIQLECRLPASLPQLMMDPDRIQQVLTNLLDNALKCTPAGGRIDVRAWQTNATVQLEIADTGPGIPEQMLSRIFDRYWQVQATGRSGAGLGLAIAKGIVEAHGGSISATSEPGLGTTIHFALPLADASPPDQAVPHPPEK